MTAMLRDETAQSLRGTPPTWMEKYLRVSYNSSLAVALMRLLFFFFFPTQGSPRSRTSLRGVAVSFGHGRSLDDRAKPSEHKHSGHSGFGFFISSLFD